MKDDEQGSLPKRTTNEEIIESPKTHNVLDYEYVGTMNGTTPSVKNLRKFKGNNTGAVTVTQFLHGQEGQVIKILGDGQMTITHGANIKTNTGANKLLLANIVYTFVRFFSVWYEEEAGTGGGGGSVDSFNGRTGVVTPEQADYDSFFLTPAEGDSAYSVLGHTHDSRYYTETEVDGFFAGLAAVYAAISHTHAASAIVSGTIDQARLGSGSGGAGSKFLADDQTYKSPSAVAGGSWRTVERASVHVLRASTTTVATTGDQAALTTGTIATPTPADTNVLTRQARMRFTSATGANSQCGVRQGSTSLMFTKVGIKFRLVFGQEANVTGHRAFLGLTVTDIASMLAAGDPSAALHIFGIGYDAGDSSSGNWIFMRNDGSGTATRVDTGVARSTSDWYRLEIDTDAGTSYNIRIVDLSSGSIVYSATVTTDLPDTVTVIKWGFFYDIRGTGTAAILSFSTCYLEFGSY